MTFWAVYLDGSLLKSPHQPTQTFLPGSTCGQDVTTGGFSNPHHGRSASEIFPVLSPIQAYDKSQFNDEVNFGLCPCNLDVSMSSRVCECYWNEEDRPLECVAL